MKARRIWWLIVVGLLLASIAWALYVIGFYLFLAHTFPTREAENRSWTAILATVQGYAVAFGPLFLMLAVTVASDLFGTRSVNLTTSRPKQYGSYAALALGVLLAAWGLFIGGATSATGTYGWLLRQWAICTGTAMTLCIVAFTLGSPRVRWISVALVIVTLISGLDPAQRLERIGWFGR